MTEGAGHRRGGSDLPRRFADTHGFVLGHPKAVHISGDGKTLLFLRARTGTDPLQSLYSFDLSTGAESLLADPRSLELGDDLTPEEEWMRRERSREQGRGIVAFSADAATQTVTFTVHGQLFRQAVGAGPATLIQTPASVMDPRVNRQGTAIAFVCNRSLWLWREGTGVQPLAPTSASSVTWGLAEHLAAEEMGRDRGFWWAPEGDRLLVARVNQSSVAPVRVRRSLDPKDPPRVRHYPFAGTTNASISLYILDLEGRRTRVRLPRREPYLLDVSWSVAGLPLVTTQTRDQRRIGVREVDPASGVCRLVLEEAGDPWVDHVSGVPARLGDGRLVWVGERDGWHRLLVEGKVCTPDGLEVGEVKAVNDDEVWFSGSSEQTEVHVWRWTVEGLTQFTTAPGVHDVVAGHGIEVVTSRRLGAVAQVTAVSAPGHAPATVRSVAEAIPVLANADFLQVGALQIRTAVLLPDGHRPGTPLPVLLDPYGGFGARRVLKSEQAWVVPRWLANQGMAVIVADGRGTPGRGSEWSRTVLSDLASVALEDQIAALLGVAALYPELDLNRVGIRGWSFGGYLAALALLRRPDVFRAAVIGAPVAAWELYDSYTSERYLGDPVLNPGAYRRSSLLEGGQPGVGEALIVHGVADDNVLIENSLQLSRALAAAGRSSSLVLVDGLTHMWSGSPAADSKLHLEASFLRRVLEVKGAF